MPPRSARVASVLLVFASALLLSALVAGCSKKLVGTDQGPWNRAPETQLTYAPLEADTTTFRVHIYWNGYDNDGEVVRFRYAIDADTARPPSTWRVTTAQDSIFIFSVDPTAHVQGHVFWIVAEDNDGQFDPTPAKRYFSAKTLPPTSRIVAGPLNGAVTGAIVAYAWESHDPDGSEVGGAWRSAYYEYILLRPGSAMAAGHPPLPAFRYSDYVALINASGASLRPPYDDWTWTRTSESSHRFTGLPLGYHVFAVRAVDAAGARETTLVAVRNIRYFRVGAPTELGPQMTITGNVLLGPVSFHDPIVLPEFSARPIQVLGSQTVTFAWSATPGANGAPVLGYSFALDDTTTAGWSEIDPHKVTTTLPPDLSPGAHFLFIRAVDLEGGVALAMVRLIVVRPEFLEQPNAPVLWVDDFVAPGGNGLAGSPNFPSDVVEDEWRQRVLLAPLASEFGIIFGEWDTVRRSTGIEGRGTPDLAELARYRTVIWSTDLNNTVSSPTGLWLATGGRDWSDLANYVRGGGTLIVTGFDVGGQVSPSSTVYSNFSRGLCFGLEPGTAVYHHSYFPMKFMGIDGAMGSFEATRTTGARDFVEARVTSEGSAIGFQSAEVDTGGPGTGAKWNPYAFPGSTPDIYLAPGLPRIDGWKLAEYFACQQQPGVMRVENSGAPIAVPILTYHGVDKGVLQDGGPPRREGLVVGIATQAHDLGQSDGRPVTPGDAKDVMGRMVFLGFPIYYVRDGQAYAVIRAAFQYVNGSPTLVPPAP